MVKNTTKNKSVRLPTTIIPTHYDLQIHPDLENFTFSGLETITINVLKDTNKITLHSKDIQIDTLSLMKAVVKNKDNAQKIFAKISYQEESETAVFAFPIKIAKGKYKITLIFRGILNEKMRGFYRSSYDIDGKKHHIATTQFESTDARRAFPCFDEPVHKAIFDVSLIIPKAKTAISNTLPISVKEHSAGLQIVNFAPTPKMSTYLLAFIVGDFEYLEKISSRGIKVRVYTTPGKIHMAKFALDVTVRCLEYYEKYFDIPYPLNTLDMIAIPDFSSLAMENWGAITFREIGLLIDEEHSSVASKELVAEVIAHELAHQWFGNLVTMEWWTHLWLNEGFASYIPYIVLDELFPEWKVWERFNTDTLPIALKLDALKNTHPIEIEVYHPDEIGEIFDAVSYSKGASVIRMLADYIGALNFRDGLRYYLKKHSYKNTETTHLWQAFEKISKKPISRMMQNWTSRSGYPVIKIETKNNNLQLSQQRFFSSMVSKDKSKDKTTWQVPITIKSNNLLINYYFDSKNAQIKYEKSFDWIKINTEESGFYRVAYETALLNKLKSPVLNKTLDPLNRLGIIRDLFALSEAGIITIKDTLEFLLCYQDEDEYIVWSEIASGLAVQKQIFAKTDIAPELDKFIQKLFSSIHKKLGWKKKRNEAYTDTLLRALVISILGRAGEVNIIKESQILFNNMQNGSRIDPNLRSAIYGIVASNGGSKEYKIFLDLYNKEKLHEEKNRLGQALAQFKNTSLLQETCEFAMSKNVRTQDTNSILFQVGMNPFGRDIWLRFITKNWKILLDRYGDGGMALSSIVKGISGSAEKKHFMLYKKFFDKNTAPGATRSIEQVKERLESNVHWLKRDYKSTKQFLKNYK